jgi:hypothetical protein
LLKLINNDKIHPYKKGMTYMAYEDYEMALVRCFGEEVESGIIRPENTDIQSNKSRTKYNRYISSIKDINPREYLTSEFEELGQRRVFEKAFEIIINIFGQDSIPYALNYFKLLVPAGTKEVLNGVSLTIEDKRDGSLIEQVEIPDFETSSNIVTIVHEFAHYYLNKIKISYNKKRYYEEIMAILAEKIAAKTVQLHTCESDFYNKMTEHRLEIITWHYGKHLPETEFFVSEIAKLEKRAKTDMFARIQLEQIRSQMPVLRTAQGISAIKGYYQNLADGYGIGFLYSESLLERFLDDEHAFHIQLAKVTNHEIGLQQMLNYYGINASNNQVYETVDKRLEEIRQFKKR